MNSAHFDLNELQKRPSENWSEFLNVPTMSLGIYQLAANTNDRATHTPHERDEVYICLNGRATLMVEDEPIEIQKDKVVYVRAGSEHHFDKILEDLSLLVFFA